MSRRFGTAHPNESLHSLTSNAWAFRDANTEMLFKLHHCCGYGIYILPFDMLRGLCQVTRAHDALQVTLAPDVLQDTLAPDALQDFLVPAPQSQLQSPSS